MKLRQIATAALTAVLAVGLMGGAPAHGAPDTATVTGRITLDGEPLHGVEVLLEPATPTESRDTKSAWTDRDGVYTFRTVPVSSSAPSGGWLLLVDGEKYGALDTYFGDTVRRPDATALALTSGVTTTADVAVRAGAGVAGRLVTEDGQPISGAYVSAWEEGDWLWPSDVTDSQGRFRYLGLSGKEITLVWGNSDEQSRTVAPTRGTTITVPDLVRVPEEEEPTGKVKVKVTRLKDGDHLYLFNTKTRHLSTFALVHYGGTRKLTEEVAPGTYRLVVTGTNTATKPFTVRAGKTTKLGKFKAPKKRTTLTGKITRRDGKPLKNGRVYVYDKYGTDMAYSTRVHNGQYKVSGLTKGRYTIKVKHPVKTGKTTSRSFTISQGPRATKNVKLRKTTTVTGRVMHGSTPVRGVQIGYALRNDEPCVPGSEWRNVTMTCIEEIITGPVTDEDGRFTFVGVPRGKQLLIADDPSYGGYVTVQEMVSVKKKTFVWNVEVSAK